jgi:integrase
MSNETPNIASETNLEDRLEDLLEQTTDSLEPISPERALDLYLDDKKRDCQQATIDAHRSRLRFLIKWCEDNGVSNLNDLTARDLHEFRVWRRQNLNTVSEKTQMDTLRVFIRWCENIGAVTPNLYEKVDSPDLEAGENARETVLHAKRAREILTYLEQYEYATVDHVCWLILAETGMRLGGARSLDIRDSHPDAETPHFDVRHRPEMDTPIKNKSRGERRIAVSAEACNIIGDYLQHQRPDVEDEYGRKPLLATSHGRVARSTIRTYIYRWSRPCVRDAECPHDRDPDECEAATDRDRAAQCPSSVTPHPIRRGYITQLLRAGVPVETVSERCNVSPAIIDQHYDVRSEEDKMRQRQQVLDDVKGGSTGYI